MNEHLKQAEQEISRKGNSAHSLMRALLEGQIATAQILESIGATLSQILVILDQPGEL